MASSSEYASYLAAGILSDDRVITYRLLSRALKVHVNTAKEMMFEFHRIQNGKKPGTVHATYLLSGTKRRVESTFTNGSRLDDDGDSHMQSSPYLSSSMPQPEESQGDEEVHSIVLAREEHLEDIRQTFEKISSIHIYSLEPHPLKDLHILSDATREIRELTATEDPLVHNHTYGTIQNKNVRRKKARGPPQPPVAAPKPVSKPGPLAKAKTPSASLDQNDKKPMENGKSESPSSSKKPEKKPDKGSSQSSTAKDFFAKTDADKRASEQKSTSTSSTREKGGSIFASFAKAKPKSKKEGSSNSAVASGVESAASAQLSEVEESPMKDVSSDDDEDDGYIVPPPATSKAHVDKGRQARKEREAALLQMMEDDDEDEAVPTLAAEPDEALDAMDVDKPEEPIMVIEGGRQRGRRRVMKKKTIKDAEGYLVTKEEPVWESFSEDEPATQKLKAKPSFSSSVGSGKSKKGTAGKAGQGNIMSFFGKK